MLLFSDRSIWTMVHGMAFGGAALLALAAAMFYLVATRTSAALPAASPAESRAFAGLTVIAAVALWVTVLAGTYIVFPPYRATPPPELADLSQYPRSLLQSNPGTAWLHAFGMEIKEHAPWIAAMLATAVAFVSARYRGTLLSNRSLRGMVTAVVAICFALVAAASLLGVFVNKVAPLE